MLRRRLMVNEGLEGFVDLGLPSGTLWAQGNIVKNGNTYSIGEETDYGAYFSWANIDGHNEGEGYLFTENAYNSTPGVSQMAHIALDDAAHDAALACLGSPCHMPTAANYKELYSNTDRQFAYINRVGGLKFMKKSDHSVYVFFPRAGYYSGKTLYYRSAKGLYWLSMRVGWGYAGSITFTTSNDAGGDGNSPRYLGLPVRAVIGPQDWIKESYEESSSVEFYNSVQDSYYGDSGSTSYYHSDISCNMEFEALFQRVDVYYSDRKEYTTLDNVYATATTMDISAGVDINGSYYWVSGYIRLYSDELPDGDADFYITSDRQDYEGGEQTYYFNIENDNGDVVGSGSVFFLEDGYAGIEITPN